MEPLNASWAWVYNLTFLTHPTYVLETQPDRTNVFAAYQVLPSLFQKWNVSQKYFPFLFYDLEGMILGVTEYE